jgi:hypothetical protein
MSGSTENNNKKATAPEKTRSGRVSKPAPRFEDEKFRELPMANNKYTKGRTIRVGIPI